LNKGRLPSEKQLVSEENLLKRREPQIATGEDQFYGMGLSINKGSGVTVVHHSLGCWRSCFTASRRRPKTSSPPRSACARTE
jgi:hypothetical protein